MMQERTILTLVRHGETSANTDGVWHGSTDTELSGQGREQARLVAKFLASEHPDAVALYSSPLRRCRETARWIGESLTLESSFEPDLQEFHLGEWEGKPYAELHRTHRFWDRMAVDPDYKAPGAESARQVSSRVAAALQRIASAHPGERVIAVSHGGALTLGLSLLLDGLVNGWSRLVENCSVSELILHPKPALLSFNRTDHLQ